MGYRLRKTIAMVGMMGAGKTAVGTALARRIGVPFIDSDAEIEAAADRSVAEIFDRDGEPFFRAKETQVIERLLTGPPSILSTGGGAWLQEANRQAISAKGVALWIQADLDLLWQRVRHKDTRPLLRTPDPYATLAEIKEKRDPIYAKAGLAVKAKPGRSIAETVESVLAEIMTRPDVLEVG